MIPTCGGGAFLCHTTLPYHPRLFLPILLQVDRAYRIGQTRNVVTYRLITAGTVEEKMYRLQVFKGGLTQSVMAATTKSGALSAGHSCRGVGVGVGGRHRRRGRWCAS